MSETTPTASSATLVCLRILRRLLQNEKAIAAQLSYLMENIHDPIANRCQTAKRRPKVAHSTGKTSSSSRSFTGRVVSLCGGTKEVKVSPVPPPPLSPSPRSHAGHPSGAPVPTAPTPALSLNSPSSTCSFSANMKANQQEPVTVEQRSIATSGICSADTTVAATTKRQPAAEVVAIPIGVQPLSFRQYWDLFGNLPTLYGVHATIIQQLEVAVQRLTVFLGEQEQRELNGGDNMPTVGNGDTSVVSTSACGGSMPASSVRASQGLQAPSGQGSDGIHSSSTEPLRKNVSVLRHTSISSLSRDAFHEIGLIVHELFASETMKHFMAEHLMYTVKLTQRSAPQLLALSRLWQWSVGAVAEPGHLALSAAAALQHLVPTDRDILMSYCGFLDFLLHSFGPSGIPEDHRVSIDILPELKAVREVEGSASMKVSPARGKAPVLPAIPAGWQGFHTMLSLLLTPLSSLRRYSHVARCLIQSDVLLPNDQERLCSGFVSVVLHRIAEETNLVEESLAADDVLRLMSLMDMPARGPHFNSRGPSSSSVASLFSTNGSGGDGWNDYGSRTLIHYGRLQKRFNRGRHERLVFLFSNWMCYVEETSSGRLRVRGTIPLDGLRVIDVPDDIADDVVNSFELVMPQQSKRLLFFCPTPEQRVQWVSAIRRTVRLYNDAAALRHGGLSSTTPAKARDEPVVIEERAAVMILPHQSRLSRQRGYDRNLQFHLNAERYRREVTLPQQQQHGVQSFSLMTPATTTTVVGGPLSQISAFNGKSPTSELSRNSSFTAGRSASTYRQLEYDVIPWSQQASVHRRIRSLDLLAAHQAPSSHSPTPTNSFARRPSVSPPTPSAEDEEPSQPQPMVMPEQRKWGNSLWHLLEAGASISNSVRVPPGAAASPTASTPTRVRYSRRNSTQSPQLCLDQRKSSEDEGNVGEAERPSVAPLSLAQSVTDAPVVLDDSGTGSGNEPEDNLVDCDSDSDSSDLLDNIIIDFLPAAHEGEATNIVSQSRQEAPISTSFVEPREQLRPNPDVAEGIDEDDEVTTATDVMTAFRRSSHLISSPMFPPAAPFVENIAAAVPPTVHHHRDPSEPMVS